jgi:hypothetical protein
LTFRRYVAAGEHLDDLNMQRQYGADYAQALIQGDPEIDMEKVGMSIDHTMTVFIDAKGEVLSNDPQIMELVLNPDGSEKERRQPTDTVSNIHSEFPLRWTGKKLPIKDAVRKFYFRRSVQLQHVDGLSFDFLHGMAAELESEKVMMLLGSGEKGTGPLLFQANGRAYRGFLSGRTDGKRYRLCLHLSDMELKRPAGGEKNG